MREFNEILKDTAKVDELSVAQLFICYTGTKHYLENEIKMRNTTIEMMYDSATKKGIVKTENDFENNSEYIFSKSLSDEHEGYHHITNNENISFYIPDTENIDNYIKHNELIGKYRHILNKCADKINIGGYMQKFFDEDEHFNL